MKKILAILLVITTLFTITTSAFAEEVYWMNVPHSANYIITDDNLTPYKVMGETGYVHLRGYFIKADSPYYSDIKLLVQIKDYDTGAVLAQIQPHNTSYPDWDFMNISAYVYEGQRIQFYFDVSSINNPPGPYRQAEVDYDSWLDDWN